MIKRMKYKGIIFDFNGVLLWDDEWHEEAWDIASEKLRGKPLDGEEMQKGVHGGNSRNAFEFLLGRKISDSELLDLIQIKEKTYRDIAATKPEFRLSPGAEELLDTLLRENIPHAIATSSEITNVDFFIEKFHLEKWFDRSLIIYDDGAMPSKPAPDIYLRAMERLKLAPAECIVIEDSRFGIEAAHRAGAGKVIHLSHGGRKEWLGDEPHTEIKTLAEITLTDFE